jgi:hypothetical protein
MTSGPVATFEPLHPAAAAAAAACRGATLARHGRRRGGQERECGQACAARDVHGRNRYVTGYGKIRSAPIRMQQKHEIAAAKSSTVLLAV